MRRTGSPKALDEDLDFVLSLSEGTDFDRAWLLSELHGMRVGEAIVLVKGSASRPRPRPDLDPDRPDPPELEPDPEPEAKAKAKPKSKPKRAKKKDS